MTVHSHLAGYLYPTQYRSRCPRFSKCGVSQKCQNYNPHFAECVICESRLSQNPHLGGYLPEGEFVPDIQYHDKVIREALKVPFNHPDTQSQKVGPDITLEWERASRASNTLAHFLVDSKAKLEEKVVEAMVDPELKGLLGRVD